MVKFLYELGIKTYRYPCEPAPNGTEAATRGPELPDGDILTRSQLPNRSNAEFDMHSAFSSDGMTPNKKPELFMEIFPQSWSLY